jgi:NAD-dependent DNA ligase
MSLESFFEQSNEDLIKAKIRQRRAQMLVHSCLYYELNESIVSDHTWQEWADELEALQTNNPECVKLNFFDNEFRDWSGATGNHLPHRHPWVLKQSQYILKVHNARTSNAIS